MIININDRVFIWSGVDMRSMYLIPTVKIGKPLGPLRIEVWVLCMVIGIDILTREYNEKETNLDDDM